MKCATCNNPTEKGNRFTVLKPGEISAAHWFCSISCLTEWAWKERESQPKLSKSKEQP